MLILDKMICAQQTWPLPNQALVFPLGPHADSATPYSTDRRLRFWRLKTLKGRNALYRLCFMKEDTVSAITMRICGQKKPFMRCVGLSYCTVPCSGVGCSRSDTISWVDNVLTPNSPALRGPRQSKFKDWLADICGEIAPSGVPSAYDPLSC